MYAAGQSGRAEEADLQKGGGESSTPGTKVALIAGPTGTLHATAELEETAERLGAAHY